MAEMVAGFEMREGVAITDLEAWPSFAEYFEQQNGFAPTLVDSRLDARHKEIFEAYLAGAHWQWESAVSAANTQKE